VNSKLNCAKVLVLGGLHHSSEEDSNEAFSSSIYKRSLDNTYDDLTITTELKIILR